MCDVNSFLDVNVYSHLTIKIFTGPLVQHEGVFGAEAHTTLKAIKIELSTALFIILSMVLII